MFQVLIIKAMDLKLKIAQVIFIFRALIHYHLTKTLYYTSIMNIYTNITNILM